jgi:hypothetical protein
MEGEGGRGRECMGEGGRGCMKGGGVCTERKEGRDVHAEIREGCVKSEEGCVYRGWRGVYIKGGGLDKQECTVQSLW